MIANVSLYCDADCGRFWAIHPTDLDKVPAHWICPICEQELLDAHVTALELNSTPPDKDATDEPQ